MTTTIKWNTGTTSTYTAVTKLKAGAKVLTAILSGKVSKGTFKGKPVSVTVQVTLVGKGTDKSPLKSINIKATTPFTIG